MSTRLTFLGAARNVTGSRYLIETGDKRFLVDCGLYQEREFASRNWDPFPIPPASLDAVLLTHAHVDHSGMIPKLAHDGFKGPIYCNEGTADIAKIVLLDAAHLQEEDAENKRKRHERQGRRGPYPEIPLYTVEDALACFAQFAPVKYRAPVALDHVVEATFRDAGHVLGSSMIRLALGEHGRETTIVFSGDVGRFDRPILNDPTLFNKLDYVVVESTYGNRLHDPESSVEDQLAGVINSTIRAGGNIVVPSFALERSQEILYHLNELIMAKRIPYLRVFLDSPMAVSITKVFENHPELMDAHARKLLAGVNSPFKFPGLKMVQTADESRAINEIEEPVMIIAGSGMCTGGRIKHHLVNNITRPESTIMFVGYQAIGTLGRLIVDGARRVRILGEEYNVRARIAPLHGFSAHADRDELIRWFAGLKSDPRHVFVTHGDSDAAQNFATYLHEITGWETSAPEFGEVVEVE